MRRRQMESLRGTERGLTRNFLEAESEEEEDIRGGEDKKKDTGGDDEDDEDDGISPLSLFPSLSFSFFLSRTFVAVAFAYRCVKRSIWGLSSFFSSLFTHVEIYGELSVWMYMCNNSS